MDHIIVVAKYNQSNTVYQFDYFPAQGWGGFQEPMPTDDPQNPDYSYEGAIILSVEVFTPANQARVLAAAQKVAQRVISLKIELAAAGTTSVSVLGNIFTAADLLASLENTNFVVTDNSTLTNQGFGKAAFNPFGGPHTDTLNFSGVEMYDSLSDPGQNEGMTGLIMHELGHLTQAGYDFFQANVAKWQNDGSPGGPDGYYFGQDAKYRDNVEAFVNDLSIKMTAATGIDIRVGPNNSGGHVLAAGQNGLPALNPVPPSQL